MKNNIFSYLRKTLLVVFLLSATMVTYAQSMITGVVIDAANNEPIIGANVIQKGTTNGTITDFDGNFVLSVPTGAILEISYIGYKTIELAAVDGMQVRLGEDTELLDEVVVVGYGVVKKNDATGSVTAIKPDDMNKGLQTNAQDMIQGKIAGVNIATDGGSPGGGAAIHRSTLLTILLSLLMVLLWITMVFRVYQTLCHWLTLLILRPLQSSKTLLLQLSMVAVLLMVSSSLLPRRVKLDRR